MKARKTHPKKSNAHISSRQRLALVLQKIGRLVVHVRGEKVLLDADLADLYGVSTSLLNRAVKRNEKRFPGDFMFQLTPVEWENLKCQSGISSSEVIDIEEEELSGPCPPSSRHGGRRTLPYAFTEQGVAMLSSVLNSERAIDVNIAIMRTFVQLRQLMDHNKLLAEKIESLEEKYQEHDENFQAVFKVIKQLVSETGKPDTPRRRVGFHPD
jgi:hypothetical protein